jgi:hypothetical protein
MSRHNLIVHLPQNFKLVYDLLAPILSNFPFFRQENMGNSMNPVFQIVTQCHACLANFCDDH